MSHRSRSRTFAFGRALDEMKGDRIKVELPQQNWTFVPGWQSNGGAAWVCKDTDQSFFAAVYISGNEIFGVYSPDAHALDAFPLKGSFARNPVGLRQAQVAAEKAIADYRAAQSVASSAEAA